MYAHSIREEAVLDLHYYLIACVYSTHFSYTNTQAQTRTEMRENFLQKHFATIVNYALHGNFCSDQQQQQQQHAITSIFWFLVQKRTVLCWLFDFSSLRV